MNHRNRIIELEGALNVRELGGLELKNGRKVKSGKLIRSGRLSDLTESDKIAIFYQYKEWYTRFIKKAEEKH